MRDLFRYFRRESDGTWICTSMVTMELRSGRIQVTPGMRFTPGIRFMNVDVAKLLEDERRRAG